MITTIATITVIALAPVAASPASMAREIASQDWESLSQPQKRRACDIRQDYAHATRATHRAAIAYVVRKHAGPDKGRHTRTYRRAVSHILANC